MGSGRHWRRNSAGDDVNELPGASELRPHEPRCARSDVAVGARDAAVGPVAPGHELGLHRGVTDLSAELRRIHPMEAAVTGEQNDDDVDRGERNKHERAPAHHGLVEIEDRPSGDTGIAQQPPLLQPHAEGDQQQSDDKQRGDGDEDDEAGYGFSNSPANSAMTSAMNTAADAVVIIAPAIATGCRTIASNRFTWTRYFRLCI